MLQVTTQKHLFKIAKKGKARGCIDFIAMSGNSGASVTGSIFGDYDYICDFDRSNIEKAMEVLFDEECR